MKKPVMPKNSGVIGARHPDTSIEAAEKVDAPTGRRRIEEYLLKRGPSGATCDEIEVGLSMGHQTASARLYELRGCYFRYTKPPTVVALVLKRKTRSGCNARVNVHVDHLSMTG